MNYDHDDPPTAVSPNRAGPPRTHNTPEEGQTREELLRARGYPEEVIRGKGNAVPPTA